MSNSDFEDLNQNRSVVVLYATETGNAQDAADYIARQCRRIFIQCHVANMQNYSLLDLLSETLVIFVVSTTGSGVEPRSMTPLWTDLLRSDLPLDTFEDMPFTVFGLGDTAYEKFCWAAKKLCRRMVSLGATEFYPRGEGDEQHPLGIDGALQTWSSGLLGKLLEIFPLPPGFKATSPDALPLSRVKFKPIQSDEPATLDDPLEKVSHFHHATIIDNTRITSEDWYQDVRHLELEFEEEIFYDPGDVAVIHPFASPNDVEGLVQMMGWTDVADEPLFIEQTAKDQSLPDHLPRITTIRTLFTRYLDLNAVPRRSFFEYLRHFTRSDLEREKLEEFLSQEGVEELYEYCSRVRRTILEVLSEFRHVKIPKDYIFDVFPPMRPREFSIASSVKCHPKRIQLCIAIVNYRTKLRVPRRGVCTSYLSSRKHGEKLWVGLRKGVLKLPLKRDTPVICVGPGTGIAPMRAVIEHRVEAGSTANVLYFGCRSETKDQHYASEWLKYTQEQKLHYRVAFSRDGPEGVKRTYVQDLIETDAEEVWNMIGKQGAWVFISGSSNKMPTAVKAAIFSAAEKYGGLSEEAAKKYIHDMIKEGRLIEECWS